MIRDRLKKLEKLATQAVENCPGYARIPVLILVTGLISEETVTPPDADEMARCDVCGKVERRTVVRFVVPGLSTQDLVSLD